MINDDNNDKLEVNEHNNIQEFKERSLGNVS